MFAVTDSWRKAFPEAHVGVLVMRGVKGPERHPALDRLKAELESDLRTVFRDQATLKSLGPIQAYQAYYKRFRKTYHVVHQLESVVIKGKAIPRVAALVEAMFMAELRNMLLTAGHDLDSLKMPLTLDVARGSESYLKINNQEQTLKAGDMMITDGEGVISSVIYGPDRRTMITRETENALFTVYGVPGISEQAVRQHMEGIAANVHVVCAQADIEMLEVYSV